MLEYIVLQIRKTGVRAEFRPGKGSRKKTGENGKSTSPEPLSRGAT